MISELEGNMNNSFLAGELENFFFFLGTEQKNLNRIWRELLKSLCGVFQIFYAEANLVRITKSPWCQTIETFYFLHTKG